MDVLIDQEHDEESHGHPAPQDQLVLPAPRLDYPHDMVREAERVEHIQRAAVHRLHPPGRRGKKW